MIKFLSSKQHTRVLLFCATATFMLFHYFFIFEIVNNFEISCQDNEFRLKSWVYTLKFSTFDECR